MALSMNMFSFLIVLVILFSIPSLLLAYGDENEIQILLNKGDWFYDVNEFEEALTYYDEALEDNPNHIEALSKKGETLV
ncbi:MAG: tetratricopeptide repeat protein, partial [Thaumarchaeota archaeon]|nr:tetratricopeptide repeat protein [Nitrososphaerota archaeon]